MALCTNSMYPMHNAHPKSTLTPADTLPHEVTNALTISRIHYAAPAWRGLTTSRDRARIDDRIMNNLKKSGSVAGDDEDINTKVETIEKQLFISVICYVLCDYFPPIGWD